MNECDHEQHGQLVKEPSGPGLWGLPASSAKSSGADLETWTSAREVALWIPDHGQLDGVEYRCIPLPSAAHASERLDPGKVGMIR